MPRDPGHVKICIIAGEASGDALGSRLMAELNRCTQNNIRFIGIGGPLMQSEGLDSLFPMQDLSVMGIFEVLPRVGKILRRIKQTVQLIADEKPDLVITIDSPDFCFRVAKKVQEEVKNKPKMVHYVAPTVWAWRPERAKKVAALYDGIMCLYPFEPEYFEKEGMQAAFVGHSVLEAAESKADGQKLREELQIPADAEVLGLLFGSRMGELNRVGSVLHEVVEKLTTKNKDLHILSPTLPHLERQVKNLLQGLPCKTHIVTNPAKKWNCFAAMDKALATSGTVGLELAVAGVPHMIAYKINHLTWRIIKRKVSVKYAHLVNILLDDLIVPECIQEECKPDAIMQTFDSIDVEAQQRSFSKARKMLSGESDKAPSAQAAEFVLGYLRSFIST